MPCVSITRIYRYFSLPHHSWGQTISQHTTTHQRSREWGKEISGPLRTNKTYSGGKHLNIIHNWYCWSDVRIEDNDTPPIYPKCFKQINRREIPCLQIPHHLLIHIVTQLFRGTANPIGPGRWTWWISSSCRWGLVHREGYLCWKWDHRTEWKSDRE